MRERYRDSRNTYDRRTFRLIPLYLQHLFWEASSSYTRQADHYEWLVRTLLRRFDELIFVTLNYDLLLDRVLAELDPIRNLFDYVDTSRPWRLIKLHGSVNWGRPILTDWQPELHEEDDEETLARTFDALEEGWFRLLGPIELLTTTQATTLRSLRYRVFQNRAHLYYPSLSVPVGEYGEFSCPSGHVEWLQRRLRELGPLNLIMIGYSGADQEVMTLLGEHGQGIESLFVVDPNESTAMRVMETVTEELFNVSARQEYVQPMEFGAFVQELNPYLARTPD